MSDTTKTDWNPWIKPFITGNNTPDGPGKGGGLGMFNDLWNYNYGTGQYPLPQYDPRLNNPFVAMQAVDKPWVDKQFAQQNPVLGGFAAANTVYQNPVYKQGAYRNWYDDQAVQQGGWVPEQFVGKGDWYDRNAITRGGYLAENAVLPPEYRNANAVLQGNYINENPITQGGYIAENAITQGNWVPQNWNNDNFIKANFVGYDPMQKQGIASMDEAAGAYKDLKPMYEAAADRMMPLGDVGMKYLNEALSGKYLDEKTNPYLDKMYNKAARAMRENYSQGIAPQANAMAKLSGAGLGGSAARVIGAENQYKFGRNLEELATDLYGNAYDRERALQQQAMGYMGNVQSALEAPANMRAKGAGAMEAGAGLQFKGGELARQEGLESEANRFNNSLRQEDVRVGNLRGAEAQRVENERMAQQRAYEDRSISEEARLRNERGAQGRDYEDRMTTELARLRNERGGQQRTYEDSLTSEATRLGNLRGADEAGYLRQREGEDVRLRNERGGQEREFENALTNEATRLQNLEGGRDWQYNEQQRQANINLDNARQAQTRAYQDALERERVRAGNLRGADDTRFGNQQTAADLDYFNQAANEAARYGNDMMYEQTRLGNERGYLEQDYRNRMAEELARYTNQTGMNDIGYYNQLGQATTGYENALNRTGIQYANDMAQATNAQQDAARQFNFPYEMYDKWLEQMMTLGMNSTQNRVSGGGIGGLLPSIIGAGGGIAAAGLPFLLGSSREFKRNIAALQPEEAKWVLNLQPKKFDWRHDKRADLGVIAEDVSDLHADAAWIENGIVVGIKPMAIVASLLAVIKDQEKRIEALERKGSL